MAHVSDAPFAGLRVIDRRPKENSRSPKHEDDLTSPEATNAPLDEKATRRRATRIAEVVRLSDDLFRNIAQGIALTGDQ